MIRCLFFHDKSNMGPSFYANMGNGNIKADWIPDGYRSYRATIDGVECVLLIKNGRDSLLWRLYWKTREMFLFNP